MHRQHPRMLIDVDASTERLALRRIVRCRTSAAFAGFCARLEALDWRVRRAFVRFVHVKLNNDRERDIALLARISPLPDECHIDYAWDYRIERLVKECLYLEHTMWTLSTFGGAVSAMGDFIEEFVEKALKISLKQREIAFRLSSPILVSRCNMYIGLALAQMGHFAPAFKILRHEFRTAHKLGSDFLANCARGLWAKISYMRKEKLLYSRRLYLTH